MDNVDLSKLSEKERIFIEKLSKGEGLTILETLKRIRRVFRGFLVLFIIITAVGINEIFSSEGGSFYSYLFVYLIATVIFYFMPPTKLGAKIVYYKLI
ncbi:hypothetical protein [Pantoea agglomerans]|uniref:hypothetical protein n=1 Tax=Enterobacter agglomerans TaxID=549 RepID=UPI001785BFB3|nr:hypothetical protein [Pantoea agglomerans]MBD8132407.1 hypothetical protein [Pantoea agglomerans]